VSDASTPVKHLRTYQVCLNGAGEPNLEILGDPDDADLARLMSSENVVAADEVVRWLTELNICRDEEGVRALARALNLMRVTESGDDVVRKQLKDLESVDNRVREAVKTLRKELPRLIAVERQFGPTPGIPSANVFEALFFASARADMDFSAPPPKITRFESWHSDAIYLKFVLTRMAERLETQIGFTGGEIKGIKFIKTALERVGTSKSGAAIAQAFERNA
jgi:hypothetical protein